MSVATKKGLIGVFKLDELKSKSKAVAVGIAGAMATGIACADDPETLSTVVTSASTAIQGNVLIVAAGLVGLAALGFGFRYLWGLASRMVH